MARLFLPIAIGALAACYTGPSLAPDTMLGPAPATATNTSANPASSDLPCDLATLLAAKCTSCHGTRLVGGAPNPLLSLADLTAPSKSEPGKSYAALSIERMQDPKKPMPPNGSATPSDVAVFQAWVDAGTPAGTCASASTNANYDTPLICTSGSSWTRGDHGSSSMHPGGTCIDCHTTNSEDGPRYAIAGTVFPTAHEPDDCFGYGARDATVVITGADGTTLNLAVNGAGNFYSRRSVALPYTAKVIIGDRTREMTTPQTKGDCNSCHTTDGAEKAPGRIMAP